MEPGNEHKQSILCATFSPLRLFGVDLQSPICITHKLSLVLALMGLEEEQDLSLMEAESV